MYSPTQFITDTEGDKESAHINRVSIHDIIKRDESSEIVRGVANGTSKNVGLGKF